jgi:hypothetical protein
LLLCRELNALVIGVRLAPELKLKLAELAKRERRSLSKPVEVLLEESLLRARKTNEDDQCSDAGRCFGYRAGFGSIARNP